jgi:hypothetical protein
MRVRSLLMALLLLPPAAATARDLETCAALYRQLHNSPQLIGNTHDKRRYAQELSEKNSDIRSLRVDMRNAGCGGGSIVVLGQPEDSDCSRMRQELQSLEAAREVVVQERNDARPLVRSSEDRAPILAALRQNNCTPSDLAEQNHLEEQERMKVPGLALPKEDGYSGITDLRSPSPATNDRTATAEPFLPQPARPYDPDKKVRSVGPAFFPEQDIDLANPRNEGPQPQQ